MPISLVERELPQFSQVCIKNLVLQNAISIVYGRHNDKFFLNEFRDQGNDDTFTEIMATFWDNIFFTVLVQNGEFCYNIRGILDYFLQRGSK